MISSTLDIPNNLSSLPGLAMDQTVWLQIGNSITIPSELTSLLGQLTQEPIEDPVAVFLIIMGIMLVAPLLFESLRLPGIIGLILAGVVVGPYGLGLLERDSTIQLLGTVGLLFLMFLGGLETSLDDLKKNAGRAIVFGGLTFALPMILGTAAMLALGNSWLASILIASCFASHTLVALPILSKLGIMRSPVVTAVLGGTLITNILALLVLAIVVKADQGDLTLSFWLFLIPSLAIYTFATLWGVPKLGRWFFQKFGHDESAEFLFVLAALFVVSYLASLIEIEPIVGAFLAGVAITQLIPQLSPLMNRIQFIGNTLFVPFFLISVGMLVDPLILIREPQSLVFAVVMIVAEVISKFAAAWITGKTFGWRMAGILVAFGLSVAQAASTLAAITVAFNIELVDELVVNGIIAMIMVSCIASPWITEYGGKKLKPQMAQMTSDRPEAENSALAMQHLASRVMVPVANPSTEDNLLELAIILAKRANGTLLPLNVLSDRGNRATPADRQQQRQLLDVAVNIAHSAVVDVEPVKRVDDSIDLGIVRAGQEHDATLVICGWKGFSTYTENFFGSVLDNVIRLCSTPVLIARFPNPLSNTQRIVLAIGEYDLSEHQTQTLQLANILADQLKAPLEVLQVGPPTRLEPLDLEAQGMESEVAVQAIQGNFVRRVSEYLNPGDLLILIARSNRLGQPAVGRQPEAIARNNPQNSMLIMHFPT
jgi:Kef-type K+ transport system membrane component KefB/nucleotide-binding universal stress UspA family protein